REAKEALIRDALLECKNALIGEIGKLGQNN
ncbi:MAG: IclR family transcriptional regulator, partial [Serratia sp.]|nr:IclR family transcriptional regulator [Serratia sp. (in: enterobacteria)]